MLWNGWLTMKNQSDTCKFCGTHVDLDDEGVQYPSGECAHDGCDDGAQFVAANQPDLD